MFGGTAGKTSGHCQSNCGWSKHDATRTHLKRDGAAADDDTGSAFNKSSFKAGDLKRFMACSFV
jgi:hypothetical protein